MRQANLRPPSRSQKPPKRKAAASSGRKAPAAEPGPAHKIAATTKKAS